MEPHTRSVHPCPFCGKETLQVLTWPGHTEIKSTRSAVAKSKTIRRVSDGFELLSATCPNCGKKASEIKRAWKEGNEETNQERRRKRLAQLKQLGFSGIQRG